MKVGLYFGTYNPIHIGHLAIAGYLVENLDLDEVWFVVTPQNPFKKKTNLLADHHRLELVRRAIEDFPKLRVSDIEFKLPKPSYTIHTLTALKEKHPEHAFKLIMGADNLDHFHKWRNYEEILNQVEILVYPRAEAQGGELENHPKVHLVQAPIMQIAATTIRNGIKEGKDVRYFLSQPVWNYVDEMNFYR